MDRIKQVASHLTHGSSGGLAALERKSPDDVVITMAIRSPLCKAKKGGFKDATYVTSGIPRSAAKPNQHVTGQKSCFSRCSRYAPLTETTYASKLTVTS